MSTVLTLPQYDSQKALREECLQKLRQEYAFSLTYNGTIATINKLPKSEKAGCYYRIKSLLRAATLIPSLPGLLCKFIKFGVLGKPFESLDDYNLFAQSQFPDPVLLTDFWNDLYFARQCVAGANPVMIQGVNSQNPLPDTFKVKQAQLPISKQAFDNAFEDQRLYMINYSMLKPVTENLGIVNSHQKHLTAPIALFYLQDDGNLRPLAIQLDVTRDSNTENPVITPDDKQQWKLARTCIQAADGTVHELWTHATQIHYVMESIIMVTYRQLGFNHPLLALLDPHLQYTLSVNVHPLYEPEKDGKIPRYGTMFPPDNKALVKFMAEGMSNFKFRDRAFPNDMKNRFVENPKLNYPYRDDGRPIWDAIHEFVKEYVSLYYDNDQDVSDDYELQAWAKELAGSRKDGNCGLNDFPARFSTISEVVEIFGHIIFTATAHHSSIHYPQFQYAQFVPNMPLSLYQSTDPLVKPNSSEKDLMPFFPRFKMAFQQAFIYYAVNFKVNRIGEYDPEMFDEQTNFVIGKYQAKLEEISAAHQKKYSQSEDQYPYMNPSHIPNSVTV